MCAERARANEQHSQRPLAVLGAYAPSVLYGSSEWQPELDDGPWAHHLLPSYAFLHVAEGAHTYRTDVGTHRLTVGDACLLKPGVFYRHRIAPHCRIRYLAFNVIAEPLESRAPSNSLWPLDFDHAQPSCQQVWGRELPTTLPDEVLSKAVRAIDDMCHLWWRGDQERMQANHLLADLLYDLSSAACYLKNDTTQAIQRVKPSDFLNGDVDREHPFVVDALAALAGRLPPKSVEEWAAHLHLSRAYFSRQFKHFTQQSAGTYLRRLRLAQAAELLAHSDSAIDYIAWESGYRSVAALDHAFAAAYGCSPSAYRRKHS